MEDTDSNERKTIRKKSYIGNVMRGVLGLLLIICRNLFGISRKKLFVHAIIYKEATIAVIVSGRFGYLVLLALGLILVVWGILGALRTKHFNESIDEWYYGFRYYYELEYYRKYVNTEKLNIVNWWKNPQKQCSNHDDYSVWKQEIEKQFVGVFKDSSSRENLYQFIARKNKYAAFSRESLSSEFIAIDVAIIGFCYFNNPIFGKSFLGFILGCVATLILIVVIFKVLLAHQNEECFTNDLLKIMERMSQKKISCRMSYRAMRIAITKTVNITKTKGTTKTMNITTTTRMKEYRLT